MTKIILIVLGAVLAVGAFVAYNYLTALGCAMMTTGCRNYRVDYFGNESFLFWVPFLAGLLLIGLGLRRK